MTVITATYAFPGREGENHLVAGPSKPAPAAAQGSRKGVETSFDDVLNAAFPGAQVPDHLVAGTDRMEPALKSPGASLFAGGDGFGFDDVLDALNPLQHVPVIGTIYRAFTGDGIAPAARMAGGTLYGGPVGMATALANVMVEEATGRDVGGNVLAAFDSDLAGDAPVQMASLNSVNDAVEETASAPLPPRPESLSAAAAPHQSARLPAAASPLDAALPKPTGNTPQLSPAAFQALMNSIGAVPAAGVNGEPAAKAAPAAKPTTATTGSLAPGGNVPAAAMEIHKLLSGFAIGRTDGASGDLPLPRR